MDNKCEIKKIYYLLVGMEKSIHESQNEKFVSKRLYNKYNLLMIKLYELVDDKLLKCFMIDTNELNEYLTIGEMRNHICPVLEYLKNMYIESGEYQINKVGYLYNSIEDKDIKERCGDILLGDSAFDRAINQATQILETKIKKKAGLSDSKLLGIPLVSKAIHPRIEETILKFSDKPDIQEGYSYLFKGIVSNYRNPTHHSLSFECSREYALKICAYIDELIRIVECSEKLK